MDPDNMAPTEVLWVLVSFGGFLSSLWVIGDATQDLLSLESPRPLIKHWLAWLNLGSALGLGLSLAVFLWIGCYATTIPSNTPDGDPNLATILTQLGFVLVNLIITAIPLAGVWVRRRVRVIDTAERAASGYQGVDRRQQTG